jgi:hypothetical protein
MEITPKITPSYVPFLSFESPFYYSKGRGVIPWVEKVIAIES